jgi:HEAT repeat protein
MRELTEHEYQQAVRPIRELQLLHGSRPYTPQEWQLLTQTARDKHADFRLRARALTALWQTPDARQQQEVIPLAAALLRDRNPLVRAYAANALAVLRAKQYQPQVERLAENDPDSIVREAAKVAVERFAR